MSRRLGFALVVLVAVGWLVAGRSPAQKDADDSNAARLQQLLQQRYDVLQERYEAIKAQHQNSRASTEEVIAAYDDALKAKLHLATSRQEQLAVCKQRIDNLRKLEEYADARRQAAAASIDEKLLATAQRIQAEIECLQIESPPE